MRVALDTTYVRRGPSGTATYVVELARALRAEGAEVVELANPRRRAPAGGGAGSLRNLAADAAWTQRELPRRAGAAGADVLHHPLPALARRTALPQVVTVHDLAFVVHPELFDPRFRRWAARAHRAAARGADAVVAVSQATADDLRAHWGVAATVAPHGPGQRLAVTPGEPRHLLYVGDDEPRKDVPVLLAAYARYRQEASAPLPLVLAGRADPRGVPGVRAVAAPDPVALAALYAHAAALVHPSRHEGAGLTLREAMGAGVPVVAARGAAIDETCGGAALLVEPHDHDALAAAIHRITTDGPLRADLAARGRERADRGTWTSSARAHLKVYSLALKR